MASKIFIDSRYANATPILENGGELIFVPPRRPIAEKDFFDNIVHTVLDSDTVDGISYLYYGSELFGWVIADFNNLLFPDDDLHRLKTVILPSAERLFTDILPGF